MAITKATRDAVLVEARHRCTVCSEKAFEIHHLVEQAEGGSDEQDNLIVLCPTCHQQRYHRNKEFTRDQLRQYKARLKEKNEIERRLLLNLEEIKSQIGVRPTTELEADLRRELSEAGSQVSPDSSPGIANAVASTSQWLAEQELLKGGARRAIEIEWELERQRAKAQWPKIEIVGVDENAWSKAADFPAAYTLVLQLNRAPTADWVAGFEAEYKQSFYHMKRRTRVAGNRIVMIVADSDDMQGHVDFAKRLVENVNRRVEQFVLPDIDRQVDQGKAQALREFDTIKSLRSVAKNLKL